MSSRWKRWQPEDPETGVVIVVVLVAAAVGLALYFWYHPGFLVAARVFYYLAWVAGAVFGLIALVIGPIIVYMFIIEPLRDWYIERKYKWARSRDPRFREWLGQQVSILRELGFLKDYDDLSEKQRLTRITARLNKEFDLPAVVHYPCFVAGIDKQRVWFKDTEDERWTDGDGYIEFLGELAHISGGAFAPEELSAESAPDGKSALLRFRHAGSWHESRVETEDDWLDVEVIECVNRAMENTGVQFVTPNANTGQMMYLVCLSKDHQRELRKRAGWRF